MTAAQTPGPNAVDRLLPDAIHSGYGPNRPGALDLTTIRAMLWRQKFVLVLITGLALALGLVLTILKTPIYEATATVRLNLTGGQIIEGQDLDPYLPTQEVFRQMTTMGEVVKSRSMALRVVDNLNLQDDERVLEDLSVTGDAAVLNEESRRQAAASLIRANISVDVPELSRIISINYRSKDPALAAQLANAYVDGLLAADYEEGLEANTYAREYLENQLAQVRERLRDEEERAVSYARSNAIIGNPSQSQSSESEPSAGAVQTLAAADLSNVSARLSEARAERIAAEQRWRVISGIPASQVPDVQRDAGVSSLLSEKARLTGELSNLRERYRDDYPLVRELQERLEAVDQQIATRSADIKAGIRNDYLIARQREQAIAQDRDQVFGAAIDEQDRQVEYSSINREVEALRLQLNSLLQRYNQISSASNIRASSISRLDPATTPGRPFSPSLFRNLIFAFVVGAASAGALAILREIFDDRLRSGEDVERKLGLLLLGQTPFSTDGDVMSAIADPFSAIGESYSSIRARLSYEVGNQTCPVIQFTSSVAGEGKTTTTVATAITFAKLNQRVLLIDLDLRRPSVPKMLGLQKPKTGIIDVLFGRSRLQDVLIKSEIENLDVLPAGPTHANPVEILSSGLVGELIQQERRNYDVILLDSSPLMGIADAPLISQYASAVVFVVEANETAMRRAKTALKRLYDVDANVLGAVVTKFKALEAGDSYSYQYDYYRYSPTTE